MGQSGNRFVLDKGIVKICIEGLLCSENGRPALLKQTAISLLAVKCTLSGTEVLQYISIIET